MYADKITPSMDYAIKDTERRRKIQSAYNAKHGITPKTIVKDVRDIIEISDNKKKNIDSEKQFRRLSKDERSRIIRDLTKEMKEAAKILEFEHAAFLRDKIEKLKSIM